MQNRRPTTNLKPVHRVDTRFSGLSLNSLVWVAVALRAGRTRAESDCMTTTAIGRTPRPASYRWRQRASMAADAFLVVLFSLFCFVQLQRVAEGDLATLPFALEQALLVGIYLVRRKPLAVSTRISDWTVATLGGWLSLTYPFLPGGDMPGGWVAVGVTIQICGALMVLAGFLNLGRSFGIVAANRGLKVGGLYSVVRHPIYLAHAITAAGLVIAEFSAAYLALWVLILAFQVMRIRAEERVLSDSSDYAEYATKVRYRLVPGLY